MHMKFAQYYYFIFVSSNICCIVIPEHPTDLYIEMLKSFHRVINLKFLLVRQKEIVKFGISDIINIVCPTSVRKRYVSLYYARILSVVFHSIETKMFVEMKDRLERNLHNRIERRKK